MPASSEASFTKMHGEKLNTQLGEVSFHGQVRNCPGAQNFKEVDRSKVEVLTKLPEPKSLKDIRSFLGHAGF